MQRIIQALAEQNTEKQYRVIVYENKDGSEIAMWLPTVEDEQYERAQAEREVHSRDTYVAGYHFEWRNEAPSNGLYYR